MTGSKFKKSIFFKAVSTLLVLTFSFYNVSFAAAESKNAAFVTEGINLSPLPGAFYRNNEDTQEEFKAYFESIPQAAEGMVNRTTSKWLDATIEDLLGVWAKEQKENPEQALYELIAERTNQQKIHSFYLEIVGAGLWKYLEGKGATGDYTKIFNQQKDLIEGELKKVLKKKVIDLRKTPGVQAGSLGAKKKLSTLQATIIDKAIAAIRTKKKYRKISDAATDGTFFVMDAAKYKYYLKRFIGRCPELTEDEIRAIYDVVCHPGTNGTKKNFDPAKNNLEDVEKNYYITDENYKKISSHKDGLETFGRHEYKHILSILGLLDVPEGVDEEDFINSQPDSDIRSFLAELGSVYYKEQLLKSDPKVKGRLAAAIEKAGEKINSLKDVFAFGSVRTLKEQFENEITRLYENIFGASFTNKTQETRGPPENRIETINGLLGEIEKEENEPGSGVLPEITIISDYHGEIKLFLDYVADAVSARTGKDVKLNHEIFPKVSIKKQLIDQEVDIKESGVMFYLLGDFLDRGAYGVKCFRAAEELVRLGVAEYVTGNHDLWALLNLSGFSLPTYEGYNFYGHTESDDLVKEHWNDTDIAKDRTGWWTEKLAEYNAAQKELQDTIFDGNAKDIREGFVGTFKQIRDQLGDEERDLWEKLTGLYDEGNNKYINVYTGFNSIGLMSVQWWEEKLNKLEAILQMAGSRDTPHGISVWTELRDYTKQATDIVRDRLNRALEEDSWHWKVINDINHQAYTSAKWWGKDWSSHKGWGTSVIEELNKSESADIWNQSNYIKNPHLQDLASFYRENFTLYRKDAYGNIYTHGWLPIDMETGLMRVTYKGVTYEGAEVWKGLERMQEDIRDISKPLSEVHEALTIVNSWYADNTTRIKPKHIKEYIEEVGLAKIYKANGINGIWFTGHNILSKLLKEGISFIERQEEDGCVFAHVSTDKGMSWQKFKDLGGKTRVSKAGIRIRGYAYPDRRKIRNDPYTLMLKKNGQGYERTVLGENPSMGKEEFLEITKAQLEREREELLKKKDEGTIGLESTMSEIARQAEEILNAQKEEASMAAPSQGVELDENTALADLQEEKMFPDVKVRAIFNKDTGELNEVVKLIGGKLNFREFLSIVGNRVWSGTVLGGTAVLSTGGEFVVDRNTGNQVKLYNGDIFTVDKMGITVETTRVYMGVAAARDTYHLDFPDDITDIEDITLHKVADLNPEPVVVKIDYDKTDAEAGLYAALGAF